MGQMTILPPNAVTLKDGHAITTSLTVAEVFGKQHKNVLQTIKSLDCLEEFVRLNFQPISYMDAQNRLQPMYEMTKDGFTFLVMGFTGAKAAQFKVAYIQRFNEMEAALHHTPAIDPAQLSEMIRQAVAAALPQAVSTEPRRQVMVDAADYELLKLKAEQKTGRVPFTEDEKTTMRVLRAQGKGPTEIGLKINRTADSVSDFLGREKKKAAKSTPLTHHP